MICGDNGVGKTNILEAVYCVSVGKSFRLSEIAKLVSHDNEYAKIDAWIDKNNGRHHLRVVVSDQYQKCFVDQVLKPRISDFIGYFNAVLFAPGDIYLLTQPPKYRRRLVDTELGKLSKTYLEYLNEYGNLLKDRNVVLKSNHPDLTLIETIDDRMTVLMIEVARQRNEFLMKLVNYAKHYYSILVPEAGALTILYDSIDYHKPYIEFREQLRQGVTRDILSKQTNYGVHRDDFMIKVNDVAASEVCSQGQMRLLVLSLKLALCDLIEEVLKERPVLLLDDVLSELDFQRQQQLVRLVAKQQTIITATHIDADLGLTDMQLINLPKEDVMWIKK